MATWSSSYSFAVSSPGMALATIVLGIRVSPAGGTVSGKLGVGSTTKPGGLAR